MFRKKQGDDDGAMKPRREGELPDISAPPLKPFSRRGSHIPAKAPTAAAAPIRPDLPRRGSDAPPPRRFERAGQGRPADGEGKKLTVGRGICLKGEITSCDKLVVEGQVEAELNDARNLEISATGYFKGSALVDEADISGLCEGELVVRELLTVRPGGRINGVVRYGRIAIEPGGEISGDMRALSQHDEGAGEAEPEPEAAPEAPAVETGLGFPEDTGATATPTGDALSWPADESGQPGGADEAGRSDDPDRTV